MAKRKVSKGAENEEHGRMPERVHKGQCTL